MSKAICVMGESGSGKTTAMRNLPPKETFYIDADGKGLSWRGWREQYNVKNKNYYCCNFENPQELDFLLKLLSSIDKQQTQFKYVVIDTLNGIMIGDEMRRFNEKGYDKWMDLAQSVYKIVVKANSMRENLTVIMLAHTQTEVDDNGYMFTRIKTNGKKLNKIALESKMTTVLLAKAADGNFVFETYANKSTAKTPMGAFEEKEIPNDIMIVVDKLKDF